MTATESTVSVFCDGSLTNSILSGVYESSVGEQYVGRAIVLAPALDVGVVKQSTDGMINEQGNPLSNNAELLAIETALEVCGRYGVTDFVVYSDCQGAIQKAQGPRVEWRDRQVMHLPNDFFDKIIRRGSYLRRTDGKVKRRVPPEAHQVEIFELFNADYREFRLSESPLWQRICKDARRHPRTLGTSARAQAESDC